MRLQKSLPHSCEVHPSLKEALRFWWKLGWISFGGTAAHLAIMQTELVEKRRWISSEEFFHGLSHCMLLPGPEAQQLSIYIGWKLHGKVGGLLAGTLFVLPATVILLALSLVYAEFGSLSLVSLAFRVLKPVVVALVLRALFQIAGRALRSSVQWTAAAGSFLAITVFHVQTPVVMIAMIVLGTVPILLRRWKRGTHRASENGFRSLTWNHVRRGLNIVSATGLVGSIPILLLAALHRDFPFWLRLSRFFTQTAFVTFGGSYTVIPYVAQVAVAKFAWLNHAEMLDGFALAETTPGPLIIVVGFVGFMAGFHNFHQSAAMGSIALLVTIFYTFLPCFLLVLLAAPWIESSGKSESTRSALKLVPAAVVAALLQLTLFLVRGVVFPNGLGHVDLRALAVVVVVLCAMQLQTRLRSRSASL